MRYFKCLQTGIDPKPFLSEIDAVDSIWYEQTGRQKSASVQREALAIPVRGMRKSAQGDRLRRDVHESRWTTGSFRMPAARRFLQSVAEAEGGSLGRAKIVSLPPGNRVYPHIDRGDYYKVRNRYHLVLQSEGSWMRAGDEEVRMKTGELWWFDNKAEHEAMNDGAEPRIHIIFDLLPEKATLVTPEDNASMRYSLGNWGA